MINLVDLAISLAKLGFKKGGGSGSGSIAGASDVSSVNFPSLNGPTKTALSLKMGAQGIWNLTTNVATAPDGVTTFTPASGVYPASGANFLLCTGTGTGTLDGNAYLPNDYAVMNPALGQWVRESASAGSIASTTGSLSGDGAGNAIASPPGTVAAAASLMCSVPIASANSGTVGANGALTLGTAMPSTSIAGFYSEGIWLYFPANAITGNNAAGFYWTVFTSTTVGTVFNTVYTPGTNSGAGSWHIPSAPTAFSGTTGAAYTAVTTAIVTHSLSVPGGAMGSNGNIRTEAVHRNNGTAGNKAISQAFGGGTIGYSTLQTTATTHSDFAVIANKGRTDRQWGTAVGVQHSTAGGQARSIDTTAAQTLTLSMTAATATDWNVMETVNVTVNYGA